MGDIGVNVSQHIDPHSSLGQVVNSYNLAMGVIGIKNLGQAGYKFAKNLPQATKELLQKNGNLRSLLVEKYLSYRIAITKLKNSDEWVKLSSDVRKEIVQQEKVFIELTDAKNIPNDQWGIKGVFINGKTSEDILSIPKGQRPAPSTYLSSGYIQQHLAKFEKEGIVSRIVTKKSYETFGIGKPDIGKTEFVSTKGEIDDIIRKSNGNIKLIAEELGIPPTQLQEGGLVRIDFKISDRYKVEVPSGNEFGTNDLWLPGGKLPNGKLEAIIKIEGMEKDIDYTIKDIY